MVTKNLPAQIMQEKPGLEPVYLLEMGSDDPLLLMRYEVAFWLKQFAEHAKFMALLMPAEELGKDHEKALMFNKSLEKKEEESLTIKQDQEGVEKFVQESMEEVRNLHSFQAEIYTRQKRGEIHTLLWPTYLEHTMMEAENFLEEEAALLEGTRQFDIESTISTQALLMSDHAGFISHLLDPAEPELFNKALGFEEKFAQYIDNPKGGGIDNILADFIDFKKETLDGVTSAEIMSIISPELADHVLREALYFKNKLDLAKEK